MGVMVPKQKGGDWVVPHSLTFVPSWERSADENMNGLIREFFPKKIAFDTMTPSALELAMHWLNRRPRKCLGYKTPHEVLSAQLLHNHPVALRA
jgi:IS30 family transposase